MTNRPVTKEDLAMANKMIAIMPPEVVENVREVLHELASKIVNPIPMGIIKLSFEQSVGRVSTDIDAQYVCACLTILTFKNKLLEMTFNKRGVCVRYIGLPDIDNIDALSKEQPLSKFNKFENDLSVN